MFIRLKGLWASLLRPFANEMGAIPSSLTDDYGALLTTTLRAMEPRLRDQISKSLALLRWLEEKGKFRKQDGGERVKIALMHALNTTADIYQGYGTLNTQPQDGMTSAFFEWSQLSVSISISRKEERQNSGKSKAIDLLESKTTQAEVSLKELLSNCIIGGRITASANLGQFFARRGTLDTSALGPLPLPALIDANPSRSVSVGNINGNTHSFWRNQAKSSTASTFAGLKKEMMRVYNDCKKGPMGNPDLMIGDQDAWEIYWNLLSNQERYVINDKRTLDILGGSDAFKFSGAAFIWDQTMPDVETNAEIVDAIGTPTASNIFFINSESMEFITDSKTDFITTPMVRPTNQDARTGQILWMGALGVNNRRKNGILYGIDRTIAA